MPGQPPSWSALARFFIIGYLAVCKHRKPVPKEFFCLFLTISGVALVVTKGNFESLDFVSTGAFWGLLSSAFGAFAPCSLKTLSLESAFQMLWVGAWSSEAPPPPSHVWVIIPPPLFFYLTHLAALPLFCFVFSGEFRIPIPPPPFPSFFFFLFCYNN